MSSLHVAIVGGGITGLVLAIGLRARGVACTIYERAAGFSEIGAGIGISPNAEAALRIVDPALHDAYLAAITPNGEDYFQWIDGYATDKLLYRLHLGQNGFQGGRRSELLQAWAALVPTTVVQFRKELVGVTDAAGAPMLLNFADGTTATADVVIGCDGVWSRVRTLLFGAAYRATYSHQFCFRAVVPMEAARAALGAHRASTRFMYNGPNAHAITYPVAKGAMLNVLVVVADPNPWQDAEQDSNRGGSLSSDSAAATRQTTGRGRREEAEEAVTGWQASMRGVVSLLPNKPDRWAIFDMRDHPVPSYAVGRVALAGDAAHTAGPHLGAGAGFGIEDALVLATLLKDVNKERNEDGAVAVHQRVAAALRAYSSVRYERTQWLVQHTREAVDLFQWRDAAKGQDPEAFAREITWRFHHIWHHDAEAMLAQARTAYMDGINKHGKS
ncbi:protein toxd [Niveomyces insectorum RCEF 264]|uniref:Protein toxd n=1 Tax=Niveomyces insectorum RCEF 264 TaxID=1081102 RepID=A0A162KBP6_9HYPO|nr:protein toxd [Niveomyces insectorum RCEF 264]